MSGGSGGLLPDGSQTVSVGKAGTYTYTLSIANAGGTAVCSKDVTVSGTAPLPVIAVVADRVALGSHADYEFTSADYATRPVIWGGNRPNPSSLVGFYIPYDREPLGNPSVAGAHDREWYRANHPEWLMYKADKTTLATSFVYQSANGAYSLMPLDITNEAVRNYIWDRRIAPAIARGYKAISFDNITGVNTDGRAGVFNSSGVWTTLFSGKVSSGNPVQDDPAYYQAVKTWMSAMRQRLHEHGVRMIANISYNYAGAEGFVGLSREADVVLVENAFYQSALCTKDDVHYYNDAAAPQGDHWTKRFNAFRTVAKERGLLFTDGCGTANASVTSMSNETVSWILANYLLVRGNQTYLSLKSAFDLGKTTERPELAAANVGAPLGEPMQQGSLWTRQYAKGLVIVNPMKTGVASFDLGSIIYTDVYGNTLQGTVPVPPVSGLILIDSGRRVGIKVSIPQWSVDGVTQSQVNLGWQLVESAANSRHRINAYLTPLPSGYLASDTWTLSLLARRIGAAPRHVRLNILGMQEQSASVGAMRCALSGTGGVLYKTKGANSSNLDAAASKEGDWYRCSLTVKPSQLNDTGLRLMIEVELEDGTITYQGDGSSGVILKDVKLEVAGR